MFGKGVFFVILVGMLFCGPASASTIEELDRTLSAANCSATLNSDEKVALASSWAGLEITEFLEKVGIEELTQSVTEGGFGALAENQR